MEVTELGESFFKPRLYSKNAMTEQKHAEKQHH
jgi:hypothetical protein